MQKFGEVVSIAATTSGVTGTINVPSNCHLVGLNLSYAPGANTGDVVSIIELTWTGGPQPLRFVPNNFGINIGTSAAGGEVNVIGGSEPLIPLDVIVKSATQVTVKVTSTGNITVKVGLEWV